MIPGNEEDLRDWLEEQTLKFNRPEFICTDPIQIPHTYTRKQDVEITGFWTAVLAWGQRKTIIQKANTLFALMGESPYEFIVNHQEPERQRFLEFRHRTFQSLDTLYFLSFLQHHYRNHDSLEDAFLQGNSIAERLINFQEYFFSLPYAPSRTRKHIPSPARQSTCKRLNMFLRWMVRRDASGVDFGLWSRIKPSELKIPLDVHVDRVARSLHLIDRRQTDWRTVIELTDRLSQFDPHDPVKYDFALFGSATMVPQDNP
ncbi:MAG: TIGR02757 family protein [Lewinellaceae bacterium]|nr:TIGR02757 family protein [Lewinellaceae bacterium]